MDCLIPAEIIVGIIRTRKKQKAEIARMRFLSLLFFNTFVAVKYVHRKMLMPGRDNENKITAKYIQLIINSIFSL
jgi:hypothetical protein